LSQASTVQVLWRLPMGGSMTHKPFQVRVDEEGVLWLAGDFDMAEADRFLEMAAATVDAQREVILECSRLTFLDSSGIRAILRLASQTAGSVVIRNPCPPVSTVLTIAGLDERTGVRVDPPVI
jgi:anti-anti-sigma factor